MTYVGLGNTLRKGLVADMLLKLAGVMSKFFNKIWFFTGDYAMNGFVKFGIVAALDDRFVMFEMFDGALVRFVGMLDVLDGMLFTGTDEAGMFW